jgi:uncharacterized phage protein gp47/JayE
VAFSIPSIADIGTRIKNAMRAYLPGTDAWIEPNNLSISGKSFALACYDIYQRILYLYRQLFASTADGEHLEFRHAAEYGIYRKASTAATGIVVISQIEAGAQTIPAGVRVIRGDGVSYLTTAAVDAIEGVFYTPVQCETTGSSTNDPEGATLTVEQTDAVPNLADNTAVGSGGLGGGADQESDDELRIRVLQRKRETPMVGAVRDYVRWALEVPGCTRAYASGFVNQPPGVVVFPLFENTRLNGIPEQSDIDAVIAHIDTVRPVTARLFVEAAVPQQIDVEISYLGIDTIATRSAIEKTVTAFFAKQVRVSTASNPLTIRRDAIASAVGRGAGDGVEFTLAAPVADLVIPYGNLPFLGNIVYP